MKFFPPWRAFRRKEDWGGFLKFDKISCHPRRRESVTVSLPFRRGLLADADAAGFSVGPAERPFPCQTAVLQRWSDGSVRWLQAHFQADLPGNVACRVPFRVGPAVPGAGGFEPLRHVSDGEGVRVDTGAISFRVPRSGPRFLDDLRWEGKPVFGGAPFSLVLATDREELPWSQGDVTVEEAGPLRIVLRVEGPADAAIRQSLRLTAYAGKGSLDVEHLFRLDGKADPRRLRKLELAFRPGGASGRAALGKGHYGTKIRSSAAGEKITERIDAETILSEAIEHHPHSYYGDFWADWTGAEAGLTATVFQAPQLFPKGVAADGAGIVCELMPEGAAPVVIRPCMGKTHALRLAIHPAAAAWDEIAAASLQYQIPDVPLVPAAWYRRHADWSLDILGAKAPPKLLTLLTRQFSGPPCAVGMMAFGDAVDRGYTLQGRGRGRPIWINNEYDRAHACFVFHALTGQRWVLDSALATCRHWIDVDIAFGHPDPLVDGAHITHDMGHTEGFMAKASHQWVEGLIEFFWFTGRREGLEAALGIGRSILRQLDALAEGGMASNTIREEGWALRALVALYRATEDPSWKQAADSLVDRMAAWERQEGGLLSAYLSHTRIRQPFMIALTVNSLARHLEIRDSPEIRELIVRAMDDLIEHCLGPDGLFTYKELPSLQWVAPMPMLVEALTHAWRLTRRRRYLRLAAVQFAALAQADIFSLNTGFSSGKRLDPDSGAVLLGEGDARRFAMTAVSYLVYAREAGAKRASP